jgi:hypothetical protein
VEDLHEPFTQATRRPSRLAPALAGKIVMPQDARFDQARRAWNLAVDQQPAAVILPETAADVAAAGRFAAERGQRVAAQGTGHRAATLGPLNDTILVKTERMRGLTIDPVERVARAEAGVLSGEVVWAAAQVPRPDVGRRGIEDQWQPQRDGDSTVVRPQQSSLACGSQHVSSTVGLQPLVATRPGAVGSSSTCSEPVPADRASA